MRPKDKMQNNYCFIKVLTLLIIVFNFLTACLKPWPSRDQSIKFCELLSLTPKLDPPTHTHKASVNYLIQVFTGIECVVAVCFEIHRECLTFNFRLPYVTVATARQRIIDGSMIVCILTRQNRCSRWTTDRRWRKLYMIYCWTWRQSEFNLETTNKINAAQKWLEKKLALRCKLDIENESCGFELCGHSNRNWPQIEQFLFMFSYCTLQING